ncbi:hypothetical protein Noda2021_05710 [Candidatus Dependentiae bacterium Noda2021]|nr:hypothetical protein Noda2021_05710 [Candidatus Dependentiae bacterium Noda2021]
MKKYLSLFALLSLSYLQAYDVDCAHIKEMYEKAQALLDSGRPYYKSHAVEIFKAIYDQCRDKSPYHETMGLTTFQIGNPHWHGYGVERHYPKACSYFDEVINTYGDVKQDQIIPWSQLYLADGARNQYVKQEIGQKQLSYTKKFLIILTQPIQIFVPGHKHA